MLNNHQDMGILTVKELAEKAGVGTTTVLRVFKFLGFDTFYELKREFYNVQIDYTDKWENVQRSFSSGNETREIASLSDVWQEGIQLLNNSLNPQLIESFKKAMDLISNATYINLLGLRPYRAVAIYLELLLEEFHSITRQLSYDGDALYDRILQMKQDEVIVLFAFSPYVERMIDAAEVAHDNGIPIILVTDHLSCPISTFSNVIIKLEPSDKHFTIIPIIALVESIVIELGKRKSKTSIKKIRKLVETLKERGVIIE
jgi:DNA-binding MurR/RpiR family transcriptional regulator